MKINSELLLACKWRQNWKSHQNGNNELFEQQVVDFAFKIDLVNDLFVWIYRNCQKLLLHNFSHYQGFKRFWLLETDEKKGLKSEERKQRKQVQYSWSFGCLWNPSQIACEISKIFRQIACTKKKRLSKKGLRPSCQKLAFHLMIYLNLQNLPKTFLAQFQSLPRF